MDVLAVDELGYVNIKQEQTNIFFKLTEERHRRRSTLISTNLPYPTWQDFLGNPALTKALLSRLRERCHTVIIDGPCIRPQTGYSRTASRPTTYPDPPDRFPPPTPCARRLSQSRSLAPLIVRYIASLARARSAKQTRTRFAKRRSTKLQSAHGAGQAAGAMVRTGLRSRKRREPAAQCAETATAPPACRGL